MKEGKQYEWYKVVGQPVSEFASWAVEVPIEKEYFSLAPFPWILHCFAAAAPHWVVDAMTVAAAVAADVLEGKVSVGVVDVEPLVVAEYAFVVAEDEDTLDEAGMEVPDDQKIQFVEQVLNQVEIDLAVGSLVAMRVPLDDAVWLLSGVEIESVEADMAAVAPHSKIECVDDEKEEPEGQYYQKQNYGACGGDGFGAKGASGRQNGAAFDVDSSGMQHCGAEQQQQLLAGLDAVQMPTLDAAAAVVDETQRASRLRVFSIKLHFPSFVFQLLLESRAGVPPQQSAF